MTDYRVLYYPDFSPDSTWLRRVLLLSDSVVRIVPSDVTPDDSDDLLRLQDAIPGCLTAVAPDEADVAIEPGDKTRLRRAFELLGRRRKKNCDSIEITISHEGRLSVAGHVFVHDSKLSHFVKHHLKINGLLVESLGEVAPSEGFTVIHRDASDAILAGLASRIARRIGVDAITDRPMPFAVGALQGVPQRTADSGAAEGALLAAVASIMIPVSVAGIPPRRYQEIRESYSGIREAFKALTAELAGRHRLKRVDDPVVFAARVESVAREFSRQYRDYRNSRYARRFKSWAPLCVGGVLSVAAAVVSPLVAAGIAFASFGIQVVEKHLGGIDSTADQRVFHMLAGLRRDVIKRSGVGELV